MSDLIRREDAYRVLTEYYHQRTDFQHMALKEALDRVPSAEPKVTVEAKQNEGLYLNTDEETLLETEYIVVATDGMYKEYIHETDGKPRRGKWLNNKWLGEKCSVCSWELHYINFGQFKYCPNCGAKMERSE